MLLYCHYKKIKQAKLILAFPIVSLYNSLIEQQYFIIDFDSTFVTVEALDELANIALSDDPQKQTILQQVKDITRLGMEGKISFPETLKKRLALFQANKLHIDQLIVLLQQQVTPSILRNISFFQEYADRIYIISGGFKEYIVPIVTKLGIDSAHILANTFILDKKGNVVDYDKKNPLAQEQGKIKAIKKLRLQGEIIVIGDGYTDYQIKEAGIAKKFFAFTEHVSRSSVIDKADKVIKNFDELLYYFKFPRSLSYPKSKIKVLLLENISQTAISLLTKEGYTVESHPHSITGNELIEKLKDVSILGVRSRVQVNKDVLDAGKKLLAVGAFSIGTNNIDLSYAAQKGIVVFNAPYSSGRSVAELVIGELILLFRRVFEKNTKMHQGIWDKSAINSHEIRGKKLGIIGYGNIGSQVGVLAELLGMKVYFYDIEARPQLGNAQKCDSLDQLLQTVDAITVHVDGRKGNTFLIGEKEFQKMRNGVIFINSSRGFVTDVEALGKYIHNGKIIGSAVDVFPKEPKSNQEPFSSPLQNLPNVILTPHIGAATEEAQASIGEFVANKLITCVNTGNTMLGVNFPNLSLPDQANVHRVIHIHKNVPGVLANINHVFAKHTINVEGQYLKTNEEIGYVITDVNKAYDTNVIKALKEIEGTIRVRVLY